MRFLSALILLITLGACASISWLPGERFVGKHFAAQDALAAAIQEGCTEDALIAFCTERRKIENMSELSQPLITWMECNWRGEFKTKDPQSFQVSWSAIVVGTKVEACRIYSKRGGDRWLLRYEMSPDLPWEPWKVRKLIDDAENKPNQPPQTPRAFGPRV